jgi:lipopolysaccharide/colanic/teichoic acid biosynthesis glycosyltransferase
MSRSIQLVLKRTFDILVAATALILLSPIIAMITLAIKLDDGGSILFLQERVGKNARTFLCFKFRTMIMGAERKGAGLVIEKNDARITRVGRFLRSYTLDEIPQIFNVLSGDMSIVGPRPTVMSQVERYTPDQRRRLEMQPGMAGWAWVNGRNRNPWDKRIEMDIWYIDHWSFWLDLKILFKAFWLLFRHDGAYADDGKVRDLE